MSHLTREERRLYKKVAENKKRKAMFCHRCKMYGADHIEADSYRVIRICPKCCQCPE
jgi:hypothetical protein